MEPYIVVIGDAGIDYFFNLPRWPKLGGSALADRLGKYVGGMMSNAASVVSSYGAHTYLMGRVPTGEEGAFIEGELLEAGLDLSCYDRVDGFEVYICYVYLCDGERTIIVDKCRENPPPVIDAKRQKVLNGAAFIYTTKAFVQEYENGLEALQEAKRHGTWVTYDMEAFEMDDYHRPYYDLADIVFMNEHDFGLFSKGKEESVFCMQMLQQGKKMVMITKGAQGATLYSKDMVIHQPAYNIKPVDTTGAGDTFNSTFVYALTKGYCLRNAIGLATAAAARAITIPGPRGGMTDIENVKQFMKENPLPRVLG